MMTPGSALVGISPDRLAAWKWEKDLENRNAPLADEDLDKMLPKAGYEVGMITVGRQAAGRLCTGPPAKAESGTNALASDALRIQHPQLSFIYC